MLLPLGAHAEWWNDDWDFRKQITLDTTQAGAATNAPLQDVPVLLRLHIGNFGYFADTLPDGGDIRFVAGDDTTPLPFYIDSYDQSLEMAMIWVKVPSLAPATSANIFMYYGNPEATSASDPAAIMSINDVASFSFGEEPVRDNTEFAHNPVQNSAVLSPGAVIGSGLAFAGAEFMQIAASPALAYVPEQGLTLSSWVRLDETQSGAPLIQMTDASSGAQIEIAVDGFAPVLRVNDGTQSGELVSSTELSIGAWHLVATTISSESTALYVDGALVAEGSGLAATVGGDVFVGRDVAGERWLSGVVIDQLNVVNTVRSADYLALAFTNQGQSDYLVRYGEDGQREAGEEASYLIITLQNVTVDGWVVIILCAFMSIASWIIMITKGMVLRKVRTQNNQFITDFRKQQDITALDREETVEEEEFSNSSLLQAMGKDDHYQASTLYHLYHTGIAEVNKRLAGAVGADRTRQLSRQSMDAIRASIDSTGVRETQKLNSQMVLLTIAIAGGPFLGLLGTVVGVMITFAAIAASGDVNVNSIAPGIAAALAATVAGLVVAIPALFGYNYLASQIKEIVADDRVFVDEFTTRIAENYR